jgi:aspartate/glutamate racemase
MEGVKNGKIIVTQRALFQRINRALRKEGKELVKKRREDSYYVVNATRVLSTCTDLPALAKKYKILKPYEIYDALA